MCNGKNCKGSFSCNCNTLQLVKGLKGDKGDSGVNYIETTYTNLLNLKNNATLEIGVVYKIIDRYNYQANGDGIVPNTGLFSGTDRGFVYVKALTKSELDVNAIREVSIVNGYNNRINNSITYRSIGVWHSTKTVTVNYYTIRGGYVFKNLTGSIGTTIDDVTLDATNWLRIEKNSILPVYKDKLFNVKYDFINDWFEEQSDELGNVVGLDFTSNTSNYGLLFNPCDITDWGIHNPIKSLYFTGNKVQLGFYNNTNDFISSYQNNYTLSINNCYSTGIYNNMNPSDIIQNNIIPDIHSNINISITNSYFTSTVSDCKIDDIYDVNITNNFSSVINDVLHSTINNIGYEKNITGLISFDFGASIQPLIKLVYLTSTNATESLSAFLNFPIGKSSVVFNVNTGLTVTIVHGIGPNNPRCKGAVNAIINGTNKDWIELENFNGSIRQKNIGNY